MRKRYEIETDGSRTDLLILEVLLDIRGLLEAPQALKLKRGKNINKEKSNGNTRKG